MIFAVFISIPMGIYSALHRNQVGDYGIMVFSQIGLAVPAFWAGILLILALCSHPSLVPSRRVSVLGSRSAESPEVPPSPCLLFGVCESCRAHPDDPILHARNSRGGLYPNRPKQRTVRRGSWSISMPFETQSFRWSRSLDFRRVIFLQARSSLKMSSIFPGSGGWSSRPLVRGTFRLIQGVVLFIASVIVIINFVTDIAYGYLDPRIRYE